VCCIDNKKTAYVKVKFPNIRGGFHWYNKLSRGLTMNVVFWMCGTLLSFSLMAIGARELSESLSVFQLLFYRSAIGLVLICFIILKSNNHTLFLTQRHGLHVVRNIVHFAAQYGWFLGISLLPLAHVFALEFTVPIWTTLLAGLILNEPVTRKKTVALVMGISGVIVILRPGFMTIDMAMLIVLGSAVGYSLSYVATRALASSENTLTVLFYMCLIQLPFGLFPALGNWANPQGMQWLWIVLVGITALSAHYCITRAMHIAEAGIVVTLDFLRLPLIAIVGLLFYNEAFDGLLVVGALIMLLGNLINFYPPRISVSNKKKVDKIDCQ
jgi:drug/metabolite transporter (DMT)-like permease